MFSIRLRPYVWSYECISCFPKEAVRVFGVQLLHDACKQGGAPVRGRPARAVCGAKDMLAEEMLSQHFRS